MNRFFGRIFGAGKRGKPSGNLPEKPDPQKYAAERAAAQSGSAAERLALASDPATHQEILYYLAEKDPDPAVRRAVASNIGTPVQASPVIVLDEDVDVRLALAERLCALLPDLDKERTSRLYAYAVRALGVLALDEMLKIRRALSAALKDMAQAPPQVISQLARDVEREVSEPILRFCAALSDEDLVEILKDHPESWVVQAISARDKVSAAVSDAVIHTEDIPSGRLLLANEGAEIGRGTLEFIVRKARDYTEWQAPLATNKQLPAPLARLLAEFAGDAIRALLDARADFDRETKADIAEAFRRRLDFTREDGAVTGETPAQRAERFEREGRLDDENIADALSMRDHAFVRAALARLCATDEANVSRVIGMKSAKPVVALCWKAGLSMRLALQIQKDLCHIQPRALIYPREGTAYPLGPEELEWQLDFLGLS